MILRIFFRKYIHKLASCYHWDRTKHSLFISCALFSFQAAGPCPRHTARTYLTTMSAVRGKVTERDLCTYCCVGFLIDGLCACVSVIRDPPAWEVGVYLLGFLVLLGIVGVSLWKLWRSGSFPAPSPYPNFNYRYLQKKYGTSYSEVRQKVIGFVRLMCVMIQSVKPDMYLPCLWIYALLL